MAPDGSTRRDIIATAARAARLLSAAGIARIATFLEAAQTPAGGFPDRAGHPDLYYTVFGLGGCLALGRPIPLPEQVCTYLDTFHDLPQLSFVELVSLIRCRRYTAMAAGSQAWSLPQRDILQKALSRYRSRDGGYSHEARQANSGTLYALFLAEQALADLGLAWDGAARAEALIAPLRTPDGGYGNHRGTTQGIATVTASAVSLLAQMAPGSAAIGDALAYLESLHAPAGGYRATPQAGPADLLSTASALYARSRCPRRSGNVPPDQDAAFVEALWSDAGGFRGHPADPVPDVEYTFYALLALGAVQALQEPPC